MILSHKHKFVFIKGMKVAGTSVEIALSQICGPRDIITPIMRVDERQRFGKGGEPRNYLSPIYPAAVQRFFEQRFVRSVGRPPGRAFFRGPRSRFVNHMDLRTVLKFVPAAEEYQVLCVERSPYAKVMSLASWTEHHAAYANGQPIPGGSAGVTEGVDRLLEDGSIRRVLNIDLYRRADDRVTVKPWRTGTLASDLGDFFRSLGLEPVPLVSAKRGSDSDSIEPSNVLRPDQIGTINDIFAEEFEIFGWPMIGENERRSA